MFTDSTHGIHEKVALSQRQCEFLKFLGVLKISLGKQQQQNRTYISPVSPWAQSLTYVSLVSKSMGSVSDLHITCKSMGSVIDLRITCK